jgi:ferritin-like metal-binding protein YciE
MSNQRYEDEIDERLKRVEQMTDVLKAELSNRERALRVVEELEMNYRRIRMLAEALGRPKVVEHIDNILNENMPAARKLIGD